MNNWPSVLTLVRHGESEGNILELEERPRLRKSTADYELTDKGRRQALVTRERLGPLNLRYDAYFSSYYIRAIDTLKLLCEDPGITIDSRVAEHQRGIWHTYAREEVEKYFPLEFERKRREGYYHYRPPGGENWMDVEVRVRSFLATLREEWAGKRVIVATHGGWLASLKHILQDISIEETIRNRSAFKNLSITTLEAGRLVGENEVFWNEEDL